MAQDSLRRLAGELRRFIANQEEDEFILTAAPQRAADILPSASVQPAAQEALPKMPEGETLTVEFTRKPKSITPSAAVEVQPTAETGQAADSQISLSGSLMTTAQKTTALAELAETIKSCTRCPLGSSRLNAVPGEGNVDADLMFVGEGPGFDEDRQGRPFVGRAGQLLDKMIAAMGLKREQVFIANIAKCHPMTDPLHPEKHGNDRSLA